MKFSGIDNVDTGSLKNTLYEQLKTQAHIWFFCSDITLNDVQRAGYLSKLSADEKQHYQGFHFPEDKQNYLIAHVLLRIALSKYVDVAAENWVFTCDSQGKPEVDQTQQLPAIDFNITHTDGMCACVITLDAASGIDAESINRVCNHKGLAQRMFSEQECALLALSEQPAKQFYKYWTLREAYFKALGSGLSGSSKDLSFMLSENDENISIHNSNKVEEGSNCQFALYKPGDKHVLAVALTKKEKTPFKKRQLFVREVFTLADVEI
jgi:4'-phosphopantetheinyl transferase